MAAFQTLKEGESATDSFVVEVDDGDGGIATANITITIHGNNDYHNAAMPLDVNKDGSVAPVDALQVINWINEKGTGEVPGISGEPESYLDVNNDGSVTPVDVLQVINFFNDGPASEGEAVAGLGAFATNLVFEREYSRQRVGNDASLPVAAVDTVFQGWQLTRENQLDSSNMRLRAIRHAKQDLTLEEAIEEVADGIISFRLDRYSRTAAGGCDRSKPAM